MKKSKFSISRLFRNDKFLMVFAFISSCILWFVFSMNSSEDTVTTITDVPITVVLSQSAMDDGFQVFSKSNDVASVSISGNKITAGSIKPEDILVTATQSGSLSSANTYPLELKAKQNSGKTNYSIISVDPSFVNVYIDRARTLDIKVTDKIKYDFTVDETYYAGNPIYSKDTVTVSGPENEVLKIDSVALEGEITGKLQESETIKASVVLYNERGEKIDNELITVSDETIDVTLNVLPEKEIPIRPKFANVPKDFNLDERVTVEPESIVVAGSKTALTTLPYISLDEIDFNDLNPENDAEFDLDVQLPSGCRNISNITSAKVKIDFTGYTSTQMTVTDFEFRNVDNSSQATATTTDITVVIAGPEEILSELSDDDLVAIIDLRDKGASFEGSTEIPVTINVKNKSGCWIYGSYTVNVNVEKKTEAETG